MTLPPVGRHDREPQRADLRRPRQPAARPAPGRGAIQKPLRILCMELESRMEHAQQRLNESAARGQARRQPVAVRDAARGVAGWRRLDEAAPAPGVMRQWLHAGKFHLRHAGGSCRGCFQCVASKTAPLKVARPFGESLWVFSPENENCTGLAQIARLGPTL